MDSRPESKFISQEALSELQKEFTKPFISNLRNKLKDKVTENAARLSKRFLAEELDCDINRGGIIVLRELGQEEHSIWAIMKTKEEVVFKLDDKEYKRPVGSAELLGPPGSFGKVKSIVNIETGEKRAVKVLHRLTDKAIQEFKQEAENLKFVGSTAIFLEKKYSAEELKEHKQGSSEKQGKPCIVMDIAPGFRLTELLEGKTPHTLSPLERINILFQASKFIDEKLHSKELKHIHGDLNPNNIKYDPEDGTVTVIDFGTMRQAGSSKRASSLGSPGERIGTPGFISPDMASSNKYLTSFDVFSMARIGRDLFSFEKRDADFFSVTLGNLDPLGREGFTSSERRELESIIEAMEGDPPTTPRISMKEAAQRIKAFREQYLKNHPELREMKDPALMGSTEVPKADLEVKTSSAPGTGSQAVIASLPSETQRPLLKLKPSRAQREADNPALKEERLKQEALIGVIAELKIEIAELLDKLHKAIESRNISDIIQAGLALEEFRKSKDPELIKEAIIQIPRASKPLLKKENWRWYDVLCHSANSLRENSKPRKDELKETALDRHNQELHNKSNTVFEALQFFRDTIQNPRPLPFIKTPSKAKPTIMKAMQSILSSYDRFSCYVADIFHDEKEREPKNLESTLLQFEQCSFIENFFDKDRNKWDFLGEIKLISNETFLTTLEALTRPPASEIEINDFFTGFDNDLKKEWELFWEKMLKKDNSEVYKFRMQIIQEQMFFAYRSKVISLISPKISDELFKKMQEENLKRRDDHLKELQLKLKQAALRQLKEDAKSQDIVLSSSIEWILRQYTPSSFGERKHDKEVGELALIFDIPNIPQRRRLEEEKDPAKFNPELCKKFNYEKRIEFMEKILLKSLDDWGISSDERDKVVTNLSNQRWNETNSDELWAKIYKELKKKNHHHLFKGLCKLLEIEYQKSPHIVQSEQSKFLQAMVFRLEKTPEKKQDGIAKKQTEDSPLTEVGDVDFSRGRERSSTSYTSLAESKSRAVSSTQPEVAPVSQISASSTHQLSGLSLFNKTASQTQRSKPPASRYDVSSQAMEEWQQTRKAHIETRKILSEQKKRFVNKKIQEPIVEEEPVDDKKPKKSF